MAIPFDPSHSLQHFAHPEKLVTGDWLGARLGAAGLKVLESNEDKLLYDIGHIPTAQRVDWASQLNDAVVRDVVNPEDFSALLQQKGISREDTVVIYGDRSNHWAVFTLWVFELFGHPDVRLLDGGRDAWMQEEKETSFEVPCFSAPAYPVVQRDDATHRIFVSELREVHAEVQLIDARDTAQFEGRRDSGRVQVSRQGHIPGARNLTLEGTKHANCRYRSPEALSKLYAGLDPQRPTVVYCEDGARAAQHWFVLHHLLGWPNVRVYDGSWVEWGNMIRVPITTGVTVVT